MAKARRFVATDAWRAKKDKAMERIHVSVLLITAYCFQTVHSIEYIDSMYKNTKSIERGLSVGANPLICARFGLGGSE